MVLCSGLLGVQTEKLILTGGHYGLVEGTSVINGPKCNKGPITSIGVTSTSAIEGDFLLVVTIPHFFAITFMTDQPAVSLYACSTQSFES